jgi:hypothetical protein
MPNMTKRSDIKCFLHHVTKCNIREGQSIQRVLYHQAQGTEMVWQRNIYV